jgi:hypothetical protein
MSNKNTKFLQFPLFLWRNLFTDPYVRPNRKNIVNAIFDVGICRYAENLVCNHKVSPDEAARQLMYDYSRNPTALTSELINKIKFYISLNKLTISENNGFTDGWTKFEPTTEIMALNEIFKKDNDFAKKTIKHTAIHRAIRFYEMESYISNLERFSNYQKILEIIPERDPWPMINIELLFKLYEPQTEYELAQIAGYIGINSILGIKPYCKSNKNLILARMFGYSTYDHLRKAELMPGVDELVKKYSNRYHMDKLLTFLELHWNLLIDGKGQRGLWIGNKNKIQIDAFYRAIQTNKKKQKLHELKRLKDEARTKAHQKSDM